MYFSWPNILFKRVGGGSRSVKGRGGQGKEGDQGNAGSMLF